jgi:uncharacterized membrane protein YjfL (UPF0719 family)
MSTLNDRLTSTVYLNTVFNQGEYPVVIAVGILFFMVMARLMYALKLWCYFRNQVIPPRIEDQQALLAAAKDGEEAAEPTGTKKLGYAYSLSSALASDDNKALAVAMSGYMFATGIITWASVSNLSKTDGWQNVANTFAWQAIGVVLLEITRLLTDKVTIPSLSLPIEVVKNRNLAAGIVEGCSYIGSGQIISASVFGPSRGWGVDVTSVLLWFVVGQASFLVFGQLMRLRNDWSFTEEIKKNNPAAALMFGIHKITIAMFLSNSVIKTDSALTYAVWFTLGTAVLLSLTWVIDKVVIPGSELGYEIKNDQNWGAAVVVTSMTMACAFILNTFLPETCDNTT